MSEGDTANGNDNGGGDGNGGGGSRLKTVLITYFPMAIAVLSLVTSIVNGYVNIRFLDFTERSAGRSEYLQTCKAIIDAYFQVKLRAGALADLGQRKGASDSFADEIEGRNAVAKFAALGTYLANLRDEGIRARYTDLSRELDRIIAQARGIKPADLPKAFGPADEIFAEVNADCVKRAKEMQM